MMCSHTVFYMSNSGILLVAAMKLKAKYMYKKSSFKQNSYFSKYYRYLKFQDFTI
jgi:hypothetical protein